ERRRRMLAVSGEELVPADTRQKHRRRLASSVRYEITGDDCRVTDRLVHVIHKSWKQLCYVGLDNHLQKFATKFFSVAPSDSRIVERRFSAAILGRKRDRVRANRLRACVRHRGYDTARVEAGAEKASNGHVALKLSFDR